MFWYCLMSSDTDPFTSANDARFGGQRRLLTVLFADLIQSTELLDQHGDDVFLEVQEHFHEICTGVARENNGIVAQYLGDGVMCYFGFPSCTEDDAAQGVNAALEILNRVRATAASRFAVPMRTRVGVATGRVSFNDAQGADIHGRAAGVCLHRSARLQGAARDNSVLICEATHDLVSKRFVCTPIEGVALKGFEASETVYGVECKRYVRKRFEATRDRVATPLIGRDDELNVMLEQLANVRRAEGSVLMLSGNAGIGKSKLLGTFLDQAAKENCRAINLQCAPAHALNPLYPIREYLSWVTGAQRDDSAKDRQAKLMRLFTLVWQVPDESIGNLVALLIPEADGEGDEDISALRRRQLVFDILIEKLFASAQGLDALVFVVEDVHWADPTTTAFLGHVAQAIVGYNILLLMTTRPGSAVETELAESSRLIALEPLAESDSRELAAVVAGKLNLNDQNLEEALRKASGVPLFLEEYIRVLASGSATLGKQLPLTLEGLVQSKLDQFSAGQRLFAQFAAIIGPTFDVALAAQLAGVRDLPDTLEQLSRSGLLSPGTEDADSATRRFAHALFRDGLAASMHKGRQRQLHSQVADAMMALREQHTFDNVVIAQHLAESDRYAEAAEHFFKSAANSAFAGNAAEALQKIDGGLQSVANLPSSPQRDGLELRLRAVQGPMQMVTRGPGNPQFGRTQARALELLGLLDQREQVAPVLYNCALHAWATGNLDGADTHLQALAEHRQAYPDEGSMLAFNTMTGLIAFHRGNNGLARKSLIAVVGLYDPQRHRDLYPVYLKEFGVFAHFYLALTEAITGNKGAALGHAAKALKVGRIVARPHPLGFAYLANFLSAMLLGMVDVAEKFSAESLRYSSEQGFPEFSAMARFCQGWSKCKRGDRDSGLVWMQEGAMQWDRTGFMTWSALFEAMIAKELIEEGREDQAREFICAARDRVERYNEYQFIPFIERAEQGMGVI